MSLILEALRKSEAERQAASLPGLINATAGSPAKRRRPLWPWALPLVLVAGLLLGWWAPRWWTPADDPAPASAGPVADIPIEPSADAAAAPASAESPAGSVEQPTIPPPARAPTTPDAPPATAAPPVIDRATPPEPGPEPAPSRAPATAQPAPVADAARLAQMPSAQRQALPALKLSVHVFNEDPAGRFAIVDGRRVTEGDALGQGVQLREIRRDGLLLEIDGIDWLLDRPR